MLNFFTNHIFQTAYFAAAFLVFLLFHISPIWRVGTSVFDYAYKRLNVQLFKISKSKLND